MNCNSCVGCKFLYSHGEGYSNWTWMDTIVNCALDRNPNLINGQAYLTCDWIRDAEKDNWPQTNTSRCEKYDKGVFVELDVDGDNGPADESQDEEQILAICKHSNRGRNGGTL